MYRPISMPNLKFLSVIVFQKNWRTKFGTIEEKMNEIEETQCLCWHTQT